MAEPLKLAEACVTRLRQLAAGNGLRPEAINLQAELEGQFEVEGVLTFTPHFSAEPSATYPGQVRGKGRQSLSSQAALQQEVERRRADIQQGTGWVDDVIAELKQDKTLGWGHQDALVTLPKQCVTLACTESCPSCRGERNLTCQGCAGRRSLPCPQCSPYQQHGHEPCTYCAGMGYYYNDPQQPCRNCNGSRFMLCRECQGRTIVNCPTCQGRGGTACVTCQASGSITQEIKLTAGANFSFQLMSNTQLPTGLRRGLDRIGLTNIPQTYADIELKPYQEEPPPKNPAEKTRPPPSNKVRLIAKLPYAELAGSIGNTQCKITVFGKRQRLFGVPSFIDDSLKPWRDQLADAAKGKGSLSTALEARLIKDALQLTLNGKGQPNELRRLYPIGLSESTALLILHHLRQALTRATRNVRLASAATVAAVSFGALFLLLNSALLTPLARLREPLGYALHGGVLILMLATVWLALNQATRWILAKKFGLQGIGLRQNIGAIGIATMGLVVLGYGLLLMLPK